MSSREPMADFVQALEARLRADALAPPSAPGRRAQRRTVGVRRRLLIAGAAVVLVAAAAALMLTPTWSQRAQASSIALLRTTPVDVSADPRARAVATTLAPSQRSPRVWATAALGGSAYLVRGKDRWCLSAPDPATDQPDIERGSTCTDDATFARIGITLGIGNNFIAVVPDDARAPTLREPGRPPRVLAPSDRGVVILRSLPEGSILTVYDGHGSSQVNTVHSPPDPRKTLRCPDASHVSGPAPPLPNTTRSGRAVSVSGTRPRREPTPSRFLSNPRSARHARAHRYTRETRARTGDRGASPRPTCFR